MSTENDAAVAPPSAPADARCLNCGLLPIAHYEHNSGVLQCLDHTKNLLTGHNYRSVAPPETTAPTATMCECGHDHLMVQAFRADLVRTEVCREWPECQCRHFRAVSPVASSATPTPGTCKHCRHPWGTSSGSIHSDGSGHSSGATRCCHCGEIERYDHKTGPTPPVQHGPFYGEILRYPA